MAHQVSELSGGEDDNPRSRLCSSSLFLLVRARVPRVLSAGGAWEILLPAPCVR